MSPRNLLKHILVLIACILPIIYLIWVWNTLPAEGIPLHYSITSGKPDGFGNKNDLLFTVGLILGISILVYLLLINIHKIDPKRVKAGKAQVFDVVAIGTVLFLAALSIIVIQGATDPQADIWNKMYVPLLGLLFTFLGNVMYNIKPNYFAGIRVPWTLNDEDNWKKTHRLGGVTWFIGGLLITVFSLAAPKNLSLAIMQGCLTIMVIIPVAYSFILFKRSQSEKNQAN